jgi:hypothetical protein
MRFCEERLLTNFFFIIIIKVQGRFSIAPRAGEQWIGGGKARRRSLGMQQEVVYIVSTAYG